jgi:hypothetical protein
MKRSRTGQSSRPVRLSGLTSVMPITDEVSSYLSIQRRQIMYLGKFMYDVEHIQLSRVPWNNEWSFYSIGSIAMQYVVRT